MVQRQSNALVEYHTEGGENRPLSQCFCKFESSTKKLNQLKIFPSGIQIGCESLTFRSRYMKLGNFKCTQWDYFVSRFQLCLVLCLAEEVVATLW